MQRHGAAQRILDRCAGEAARLRLLLERGVQRASNVERQELELSHPVVEREAPLASPRLAVKAGSRCKPARGHDGQFDLREQAPADVSRGNAREKSALCPGQPDRGDERVAFLRNQGRHVKRCHRLTGDRGARIEEQNQPPSAPRLAGQRA
jgi:hypothetical protein